ncbi:MAG: hypothetical protein Q7T36_17925 [Fluviicoccus sp.]|uniref:hypothetical protein n=1 Tax=Fluviicoccus sp. TaxID=2003552 RepID=UPI00272833AC|nr:hypothetical protein [Fluviicoccus sp.]MDO8332345.1 hypothetical protein [Fluviicoccus sp.]
MLSGYCACINPASHQKIVSGENDGNSLTPPDPMATAQPAFLLRTECPPGACNCGRDALLANPAGDLRVLRLTREDEKRLLQRLENVSSLADLQHMQDRMAQQVGIRLSIQSSAKEVRSLRGITILVHEQPGLCRKTRQAIPAAIKRSLEQRPEIAYEILNVGSLFEGE